MESSAKWDFVLDWLQGELREQHPQALLQIEDAALGGGSSASSSSQASSEHQAVRERQAVVLESLLTQAADIERRMKPGACDMIIASLTVPEQKQAFDLIRSFLAGTGPVATPKVRMPRRPRRAPGAHGVGATNTAGKFREAVRSRLRGQSCSGDREVTKMTEEQVRDEIEAKLAAAHRRNYARLVQQYTFAAERHSVLSGRRSLDLSVLKSALKKVEPYAKQSHVTPLKRRSIAEEDEETPVKKEQRSAENVPRNAAAGRDTKVGDRAASQGSDESKDQREGSATSVSAQRISNENNQKPRAHMTHSAILASPVGSDDIREPEEDFESDEKLKQASDGEQRHAHEKGAGTHSVTSRETGADANIEEKSCGRVGVGDSKVQHKQDDRGKAKSKSRTGIAEDGDLASIEGHAAAEKKVEQKEAGGSEAEEEEEETSEVEEAEDELEEGVTPPELDAEEELPDDIQDEPEEESQPEQKRRRLTRKVSAEDYPDVPVHETKYPLDAWPHRWHGMPAPRPGDREFNKYATECLETVLDWWKNRGLFQEQKLYQQTVEAALHPLSRCPRLLVDARVGSGKTRTIVNCLDQHFVDSRKKIPLFPTEATVSNFYGELLKFPNRYRSYFALTRPEVAAKAAGIDTTSLDTEQLRRCLDEVDRADWNVAGEHADEVRSCLKMELEMTDLRTKEGTPIRAINRGKLTSTYRRWFRSNFPGKQHLMPAAPLRALRLTTAGGAYLAMGDAGLPRNPIAKHGFDEHSGNPFDNAVVTIDEVHNLLITKLYPQQIRRLNTHLMTASNLTIAGFTGTPVVDNGLVPLSSLVGALEAKKKQLTDLVQGRSPMRALLGIASALGSTVVCVDFLLGRKFRDLDTRNLEGFVCSYHGPLPGQTAQVLGGDPAEVCERAIADAVELTPVGAARYARKHLETKGKDTQRAILQRYTNLEVAASHVMQTLFYRRTLQHPDEYVPKLVHVARKVISDRRKTVVLIKEHSGHKFFVKLLTHLRDEQQAYFGVLSDRADIEKFNDRTVNLRGERHRVFVGETGECGEGTSFFNVRKLYLLDAPANATEFEQRVARVDRGDGHRGLPADERTVEVEIACATLPEVLKKPLGAWVWRSLINTKTTARTPDSWSGVLRRTQKVVNQFTDKFGVDEDDEDALSDLQVRIQAWDESDADSSEEADKEAEKKAVNKLRLPRQMLSRLARMSTLQLETFGKNLCTATVDEQILTDELPARCRAVKQVHAPLKAIAMDARLLEQA